MTIIPWTNDSKSLLIARSLHERQLLIEKKRTTFPSLNQSEEHLIIYSKQIYSHGISSYVRDQTITTSKTL